MLLPPTVALARRDTVRLIASRHLSDPVLLPLAADSEALQDLPGLESATDVRRQAQETGLPDLDPRELAFGRAGSVLINAAFTHTRPGGNRFNGEDRGAWYCAFAADTALSEVSYHLTRKLEAIGHFENVTDYAERVADFFGPFHDLRPVDRATEAALHPDPAIAYRRDRRSPDACAGRPPATGSSIPRSGMSAEPVSSCSDPILSKTCGKGAGGGWSGEEPRRRRHHARVGSDSSAFGFYSGE